MTATPLPIRGTRGPIEHRIARVEEILDPWRETIGGDFDGYRNHVYRVVHFCFGLHECDDEERQRLIIAACYHDLGIWSAKTADYLSPSQDLAEAYLIERGVGTMADEVRLMIDAHHKLRRFGDARYSLVEVLRQADFVDVSLGLRKFGLSPSYVRAVRAAFPNAGFHRRLLRLFWQGFLARPLRPVPVVRW